MRFGLIKSLLAAILLMASVSLSAQQFASLSLAVSDPSGSALPAAAVSLRSFDTGVVRELRSDGQGLATIPGLPAGSYMLTVKSEAFSLYSAPLTLTVGQTASLEIKLRIDAVTQNVEVRDTNQAIDEKKTEASQVISPAQISSLPISDRDFIDFVLLTPTATIGRSTSTAAQSAFQETVLEISFGGLVETHSTFYSLDGMNYTTSISGVQRESPSLDWVQEFRVTYGPSTADAGLNLGSVVNTVTKSGTNNLHGGIYEYARNSEADATNLLAASGLDALRFNQFGANLGGPVRKDKDFFFVGYEGQRRAESPIYSRFILSCIDTPNCLGPGTPSINQVKADLGLSSENLGSFLEVNDFDKEFGKFTAVLNDKSVLNIGYLYNAVHNGGTPGASPGQGLPSTYRDNKVHDQTAYANLFRVLNNSWSSESIVNFGRRVFYMNPVGAGYEPGIEVADELESGGFLGGVEFYDEKHFQSQESLTYNHHGHSIKMGASFEPIWFNTVTPYFTPGVGIFSPPSFFGAGQFSGEPFGPGTAVEFIFQQPRSAFGTQRPQRTLPWETGFYAGPGGAAAEDADMLKFWHQQTGFYIQDQWKARSNLTLTAGLRYDIDFLPSAGDLRIIGKMTPTSYGNIEPRVGISYSMRNGKTVVRSGFGIFRGSFDYSNLINSWHGAAPFTNMNQPLLSDFADPANDLVGFGVAGMVGAAGPFLAGAAFSNFAHNGIYPNPETLLQFPLGFAKRKYPLQYSEQANLEIENELGTDWYLSVGYHWLHAIKLESSNTINGIPNGNLPDGRQLFKPADPRFGFALYSSPSGWSIYNAGTVSLRKNFSHYYSVLANYTYSKSIDIATEGQLLDEPQDYLMPQLDRAVGDNDVRHRLVLTLNAQSPKTWVAPLHNFEISMLNTLQSAQPYSILAGFDVNGDGFPFNDRVGFIGRNTYKGAPFYDTDLRLQRPFNITERLKANFSAEAFNLLNRVNVQDVDQVYGAAEFAGAIPKHFGDGVSSPANPTFGTPTFAGAARQLQVSLSLSF